MKPSVCIDMIGRELDFAGRMRLAKECGFDAVEFWGWWDKDLYEVCRLSEALSLEIAAVCTRFFNPGSTEEREAYLHGLRETLEAAGRLRCRRIISQVGGIIEGMPREEQRRNLVDTMREAAPLLAGSGVVLTLEPLNPLDHPGYFLVESGEAFGILEEIGSPEILLLFDIYHQQVSEGNLAANILPNLARIGHFHAAGCPGRHELSENEIDYGWLLGQIAAAGYEGFVGLEYAPALPTAESLRRARRLFR